MQELFKLDNKVAIVTGGTKGIGKAIAKKLAGAGVKVGVVGRDSERADKVVESIRQDGGNASRFLGDISDERECKRIVEEIYQNFGKIDVLVNCAGILSATNIEDITRDEWDQILSTNLTGTFFMSQKVLPYLKMSENPRIVNVSSNAGRMGGYENSQSYTASKGGIIAITMGMARQLAPYRITVNVICPGTTETEMTELYDDATKKRLLGRIPLGRFGKTDEIAAAVCFLASDEAGYITGAILDINGGMYMG